MQVCVISYLSPEDSWKAMIDLIDRQLRWRQVKSPKGRPLRQRWRVSCNLWKKMRRWERWKMEPSWTFFSKFFPTKKSPPPGGLRNCGFLVIQGMVLFAPVHPSKKSSFITEYAWFLFANNTYSILQYHLMLFATQFPCPRCRLIRLFFLQEQHAAEMDLVLERKYLPHLICKKWSSFSTISFKHQELWKDSAQAKVQPLMSCIGNIPNKRGYTQ